MKKPKLLFIAQKYPALTGSGTAMRAGMVAEALSEKHRCKVRASEECRWPVNVYWRKCDAETPREDYGWGAPAHSELIADAGCEVEISGNAGLIRADVAVKNRILEGNLP